MDDGGDRGVGTLTQAGVVSHYKLDGNGIDSVGGFDGTFNGSPGTVAGKIGTAISFSGNPDSQNLAVANPIGGEHTPASFTLSAWVNTTSTTAFAGLVDKRASTGYALDFVGGGGTPRLIVTGDNVVGTSTVNDGAWHLVTGTFLPDGGGTGALTLYVDGAQEASKAGVLYTTSTTSLNIGGDVPTGSTFALNGTVDDVGLWNDVLTAGEVRALFSLADTAALNYDLGLAQDMFDVHDAASGSVTINSKTWFYTTGLGGSLGDVVDLGGGDFEIMLDNSGTGLTTIPEPATIAMLAMVGLALLRRKV